MNNDQILEAFNNISDRQIRKNDIELLMNESKRGVSKAKKLAFAAICAAALLGLSITAGAAAMRGLTRTKGYNKGHQPTIKFSVISDEGCPAKIEHYYLPSKLPEGKNYEFTCGINSENTRLVAWYEDWSSAVDDPFFYPSRICFTQYTKEKFALTYVVAEYAKVSETNVNGCPAYLIAWEHFSGTDNSLIWDNGDYIMVLDCVLPEEELMRIAESVEINDNALNVEE